MEYVFAITRSIAYATLSLLTLQNKLFQSLFVNIVSPFDVAKATEDPP